jgi:PAB1-binding protein PBP1
VIISDIAANRSNCTIHAHVMALETSFTAQNYRSGSPRGTLTVHGGIIQKFRGGVGTGTIRNGQVVISTGYAKNYHYDPRFDLVQPPGYFLTGKYYKLAWREVTDEA